MDEHKFKKIYIKTFGCQMNEHESERMYGLFLNCGYTIAEREDEADLILINSCSIRQKAEQKVFSCLGRLKSVKAQRPDVRIGFGGCIAQREGKNIIRRAPYVDLVFGTKNIHQLPWLVEKMLRKGNQVVAITEDDTSRFEEFNCPAARLDKIKAWVTIMQGCNNYCTYCVVPYVRGREWSRQPQDIIHEIEKLADQGYKEVTLLGHNVNSYGQGNGYSFPRLLRSLDKISGIERIRFTTSHPKDFSEDLVEAIADCTKVCEHIHLPFQSGSDKILNRMNRKYTKAEYLKKVEMLRKKVPQAGITSDVIVGFPGEEDEDFRETLSLIELVRFEGLFSFLYSIRPQAEAGNFPEQVPKSIKQARFEVLLRMQNEISSARNEVLIGTKQEILIEEIVTEKGQKPGSQRRLRGRTRLNKIVECKGAVESVGSLQEVEIIKANRFVLEGVII